MNGRKWMTAVLLMVTANLAMACACLTTTAAEVPRITREEVKGMLGNPDVTIIDVRAGGDWNSSNVKIQGAVREDPSKVGSWMDKYPKDKTLIFYCA